LERSDFATLVDWFAQPHVARWWNETATLSSVEAKYGPRVDGLEPTPMWIVEVDGSTAGLVQCYRHRDHPAHDEAVGVPDAAGIDYLLARSFIGRGLGAATVAAFSALVFRLYPELLWCVATPAQSNEASWRCLERAGFRRLGTCRPPEEPPAFIYARHREETPDR
jgi:RimJ/RimL family protein N-acetyltransferase